MIKASVLNEDLKVRGTSRRSLLAAMSVYQKKIKYTDPNFEKTVLICLAECGTEFSDQEIDSESNITIENAIKSDHKTESELSDSDNEVD